MAKAIGIIVIFLLVGVAAYTIYIRETRPFTAYETWQLRVEDASLTVLVADTVEKRTRGLMNVNAMEEDSGMVFIFSDLAPRTFWNKNTFIDLDVLWIRGERIAGISRLPAITKSGSVVTVSSQESVDRVIEVNAGWVERNEVDVNAFVTTGITNEAR